jgi:hypothetical protein
MRSYFLFLVLFEVQYSCEALDGLITSPTCPIKLFVNYPYKKKKEIIALKALFDDRVDRIT